MEPDLFDPDDNHDIHVGQLHIATFLKQVDFREFFHYRGSFTTPPCTEGINWFVVKRP
jgi:carbonic anhydrase